MAIIYIIAKVRTNSDEGFGFGVRVGFFVLHGSVMSLPFKNVFHEGFPVPAAWAVALKS
jgi:hypothetical protein